MIASGVTHMSGPSGRGRGPGLGRAEKGGTEERRLSYSSPWQLGDLAKTIACEMKESLIIP